MRHQNLMVIKIRTGEICIFQYEYSDDLITSFKKLEYVNNVFSFRSSFENKQKYLMNDTRGRADTTFSTTDDVSAFFLACKNDDLEEFYIILAANSSVYQNSRKKTTPIHTCAKHGSVRCLKALLGINKDFANYIDDVGFTPFSRAAERGQLEAMKILLEFRPTSIFDRDFAQFTPLHRAAQGGFLNICEFLLDNGAIIDAFDPTVHETPLFHACRSGADTVVDLLIKRGANVNALDISLSNCLYLAIPSLCESIGNSENVLEILSRNKIEFQLRNIDNRTPLSLAIELNCYKAIAILLKFGADPDFSPIDHPSESNSHHIGSCKILNSSQTFKTRNMLSVPSGHERR